MHTNVHWKPQVKFVWYIGKIYSRQRTESYKQKHHSHKKKKLISIQVSAKTRTQLKFGENHNNCWAKLD